MTDYDFNDPYDTHEEMPSLPLLIGMCALMAIVIPIAWVTRKIQNK